MSGSVITAITLPKFGLAMTEGKVVVWHKEEGELVERGEEIADIETSKITNGYQSPAAGILRRRVATLGEDLPVGALIAILAPAAVTDEEIERFIAGFVAPTREKAEEGTPAPETREIGGRMTRFLRVGNGEGPPFVLIHGFGGDLNSWMFTTPALAAKATVYALDLPGHGGSGKTLTTGDLAELVAAVRAFLVAEGIVTAHLVGHSLGGAVALALARDEPARAASLSLIAPAGLGAEINREFIEGFITAERRRPLQAVLEKLFADPALVSREMAEDVLRYKRLDGALAALKAIAAAHFADGLQQIDLRRALAGLAMPVQVLWGGRDAILPARQAEGLPEAVAVHVFPEAGHMPQMEAMAAVNERLLRMLPAPPK